MWGNGKSWSHLVSDIYDPIYLYIGIPVCVCLVPEKFRRLSGNRVTIVGELHCGHWRLNLGSLEEQSFNH